MIKKIFLTFLFVLPTTLFAGSMGVDTAVAIPVDKERTVSVMFDAENESINAIEGLLVVTGDARIVDVRDASSMVSFWVEPLTVTGNSVRFSGIITGGFTGKGNLLSVVLQGTNEGSVDISFSDVSVFLDDGLGTEESVDTKTVALSVSTDAVADVQDDTTPPEAFSVGVINISEEGAAPVYAAIFATDDKQTGVDHYEIQETLKKGETLPEAWKEAVSPYVVFDQTLQSYVYVRAIDNTGNMREAVYEPEGGRGIIWVILIGIALLIAVFGVRHYVRTRKTKR